MNQDQELLSFAAQVLEHCGAVIEPHSDYLMTLLPSDLSK